MSEGLDRVHSRVDKVSESVIEIRAIAKSMKESSDRIYDAMYGDSGKNGIITKLAILWSRVNTQWFLIGLIITGIFGLTWRVLAKQ